MCFFVQTNHTRKELLFLMFKEINLRNHSSLHKLFYGFEKMASLEISSMVLKDATPYTIQIAHDIAQVFIPNKKLLP